MRVFEVEITDAARIDLFDLIEYLNEHSGAVRANQVAEQIIKRIRNLATFPDRGARVQELAGFTPTQYRQLTFRPYRIIYKREQTRVIVIAIVDGRRDLQEFLVRRLLGE